MTVPQLAPAVGAPTPAAAVTALRARGLRASTARRALLAALFEAEAPLTAEEVASSTTPPSLHSSASSAPAARASSRASA